MKDDSGVKVFKGLVIGAGISIPLWVAIIFGVTFVLGLLR